MLSEKDVGALFQTARGSVWRLDAYDEQPMLAFQVLDPEDPIRIRLSHEQVLKYGLHHLKTDAEAAVGPEASAGAEASEGARRAPANTRFPTADLGERDVDVIQKEIDEGVRRLCGTTGEGFPVGTLVETAECWKTQADEAVGILRRFVQGETLWSKTGKGVWCRTCGQNMNLGHKSDCPVAKAERLLAAHPEAKKEGTPA